MALKDSAKRLAEATVRAERRLRAAWGRMERGILGLRSAFAAYAAGRLTLDQLLGSLQVFFAEYAAAVDGERVRSIQDTGRVLRAAGIPFLGALGSGRTGSNAPAIVDGLAASTADSLSAALQYAQSRDLGQRTTVALLLAVALVPPRRAQSILAYRQHLADAKKMVRDIDRMLASRARVERRHRKYSAALSDGETAVHAGAAAVFDALHADGYDVVQTWYTQDDFKVRLSHRPMHGQVRELGEPFVSGAGNLLAFPGDPTAPGKERYGCRCSVERSIRGHRVLR